MSEGGSFLFLTPAPVRHGFALPGFRQQVVAVADAEQMLRDILAAKAADLVVVDERLLAGIEEEHFRELGHRYTGVLAVLPAPGGVSGEPDYAEKLIARAVGYQLRLSAEDSR